MHSTRTCFNVRSIGSFLRRLAFKVYNVYVTAASAGTTDQLFEIAAFQFHTTSSIGLQISERFGFRLRVRIRERLGLLLRLYSCLNSALPSTEMTGIKSEFSVIDVGKGVLLKLLK